MKVSDTHAAKNKMKRNRPGEQQQAICGGHQTSARFVINLENVCISAAKLGPENKGPNNNYHKETIVFNRVPGAAAGYFLKFQHQASTHLGAIEKVTHNINLGGKI